MKVRELIEKLAEFDPETIVAYIDGESGHEEIQDAHLRENVNVWTADSKFTDTAAVELF